MSDRMLVDAVRFYLRGYQHLKRAHPDWLARQTPEAEAALWEYARQASERLERLRSLTSQQSSSGCV